MTQIRTLRANVTRDEAIRQFAARGIAKLFRNSAFGPLRTVAEFYLPYRLFRVRIVNRGLTEERLVALDAVSGTLDLFQFDHQPTDLETVSIETRNCAHPELPENTAAEFVIAKLRRVLYSRGFFRMSGLEITAIPLENELFIPYWLGFRGSGQNASVTVLDAVRRRFEGAKVRRIVETWITTGVKNAAPVVFR